MFLVNTNQCSANSTILTEQNMFIDEPEHESKFEISYIYLSTAGLLVTLIISNLASFIFGPPSPQQTRKSLYSSLIWSIPFFSSKLTPDNEKEEPRDFKRSIVKSIEKEKLLLAENDFKL